MLGLVGVEWEVARGAVRHRRASGDRADVARHGSGRQAMRGATQIEDGGEGEVVDLVD
jgi:hypothetical protein